MGGGGTFYDRDTTDGYAKNSAGVSKIAEEKLSRRSIDKGLLPTRRISCNAKSPVVYAFDVTGSMGNLPKIIFDKMPLIVGQVVENGYLDDPQMSLAAVGDILSDQAPLQIGDFSKLKKLDDWLQRIWIEGNGGGQDMESYEYVAYYYARMCTLPKSETPFFLITGDEDFRDTLYASDLERHFGGTHEEIEASIVFDELKKKFNGNVFLIHRKYQTGDEKICRHWESVLGKDHVIRLGTDAAIADVTLGLFAIVTGARTLESYLDDLKNARDVAQTDTRIAEVRAALREIAKVGPAPKTSKGRSKLSTRAAAPTTSTKKSGKDGATDKPRKPGRL